MITNGQPDTPWEEYSPEIDRRTYHGHTLVVIVSHGIASWFVDESRLRPATCREEARTLAERFVDEAAP